METKTELNHRTTKRTTNRFRLQMAGDARRSLLTAWTDYVLDGSPHSMAFVIYCVKVVIMNRCLADRNWRSDDGADWSNFVNRFLG